MLERIAYDSAVDICRGILEIREGKTYSTKNDYNAYLRRALIIAGVSDITFAVLRIMGRHVSSFFSFALFSFRFSILIAGMDAFHVKRDKPIDMPHLRKLAETKDAQWLILAASMFSMPFSILNFPSAAKYTHNTIATLDVVCRLIRIKDNQAKKQVNYVR